MIRKIFWLLGFLFTFNQMQAQQFINTKVDILAGSSQYLINEVVYLPANFSTSKSYPLVMFFHGMGEAGTDINRVYNTGLPKVLKDGYKPSFDFIMVAPQHTSYSLDPAHLQSVLDEAILKYPNIDKTRIYLTGLSAGGFPGYGSTLNISTDLGKKFAGIVILSGATQDINKTHYDWWKTAGTPLWAVVGNNDISYRDQNKDLVNQINNQTPGLASITIRDGVGHGGWNDVYNGNVKTSAGKTMWDWLYQFSRNTSGVIVTNGSTPPPPPAPAPNLAPTVNAGSDKSITLPTNSLQLSSTASDADGNIASYSWSKTAGPSSATFSSTSVANPTVSNLTEGSYTFKITVTDNNGATASDEVNVVVNAQQLLPAPTTGIKLVKVNIYGGAAPHTSSDWNNWNTYNTVSGNLTYNDGSYSGISASLSGQSGISDNGSSFTASMAPTPVVRHASYSTSNRTLTISGLDNAKTYDLEIYASRSGNSNNTSRFTIGATSVDVFTDNNTSNKGSFTNLAPVGGKISVTISRLNTYNYINGFTLSEHGQTQASSNSAPTVNAGSNQTITLPASSVQLNASASDADGSIVSYSWTKIAGPASHYIANPAGSNTTISSLVEGTYTFRVTVTDNQGSSTSGDVQVVVKSVAVTKYVKVNLFGGANAYSASEWNNWNTGSSLNLGQLKYSDGTNSAISLQLSTQSGVSDNGSSYTATMAPSQVVRYASYSTSNRTLTISGLDNNKTYDIELFAARSGTSNNTSRFQVNGQTVDILTDDNTTKKASFQSLIPVGGKITISISKLNNYNYLNGLVLTEQ